jgi:F5/8 type C domain
MTHRHSTRWGLAAAALLVALSVPGVSAADNDTTTSASSASTTSTSSSSSTSTTSPDELNVKKNDDDRNDEDKKDEDKKDEDDKDGTSTTVESDDDGDGEESVPKKDDSPVPVRAHSWSTTGNSRLSSRADDGDPATEFVTQMLDWAPPTWAWLKADLGGNVPLTRVEWMWSQAGAADAFTVEVSAGQGKWITIARPGETPVGQWTGVTLERETRFVRFAWRNPNGDRQLGHLAEVRFLARPGFVADGKGMTPQPSDVVGTSDGAVAERSKPETKGDHWVVQRSTRSSNSPDKSSRLPLDGKADTAWQTALSIAPRTGWTMYDLGDVVDVPAIKWKFSQVGGADRFLVQTSVDGKKWSSISEQSNAAAVDTWVQLDAKVHTRFVRFFFTNPNADANIGFLSEVRFLHG